MSSSPETEEDKRFDEADNRSSLADAEDHILFGDRFELGCWDANNPGLHQPGRCEGKGVLWRQAQLQGPHALEIVTDIVRSGKHAARFTWLKDNPAQWDQNKNEISNTEKKAMLHAPGIHFNEGSERWYGWSMYFPSEGMKIDSFPSLFFQLHAMPDHDLNEPWRQPPVSIKLDNEGLIADWSYDTARLSPKNINIVDNRKSVRLPGKREDFLDRWVDFVCHVKVDYTGEGNGLIEIWINEEKVLDKPEINLGYNDVNGLYPSYGMYWYTGKATHDHWIYVDEVRIAGPEGSYQAVAPRD